MAEMTDEEARKFLSDLKSYFRGLAAGTERVPANNRFFDAAMEKIVAEMRKEADPATMLTHISKPRRKRTK